MSHVEATVRLKIRPGQLEGFRSVAAEGLRATREKDTGTVRCDWFINADGTEAEIHEVFENEAGLVEHGQHMAETRADMFKDFASDHRLTVYGEVSPQLVEMIRSHGGDIVPFTFLQGLQPTPSV